MSSKGLGHKNLGQETVRKEKRMKEGIRNRWQISLFIPPIEFFNLIFISSYFFIRLSI